MWSNVVRLVTSRAGHHEDITGRQLFETDRKLETERDWFVGHTTKSHKFLFCSTVFDTATHAQNPGGAQPLQAASSAASPKRTLDLRVPLVVQRENLPLRFDV